MKKRLLSLFMCSIIVFSLVACSSENGTENVTGSTNPTMTNTSSEKKTESVTKETTKPTLAPTQEPTTKQQEELRFSIKKLPFSKFYISPENCQKIKEMFDGVVIKKGDVINIEDIPFTEDEIDGKKSVHYWIGYAIASDMQTGVYVLTAKANSTLLKISYDNEFLSIEYARINN